MVQQHFEIKKYILFYVFEGIREVKVEEST